MYSQNKCKFYGSFRSFFGEAAKFERLQLFCVLAAYYTGLAKAEKDRVARSGLVSKAQQCLNEAMSLDYSEQLCYLARGQLALVRVWHSPLLL